MRIHLLLESMQILHHLFWLSASHIPMTSGFLYEVVTIIVGVISRHKYIANALVKAGHFL